MLQIKERGNFPPPIQRSSFEHFYKKEILTSLVKAKLEPEQNPPQSRLGLSSQVYSHPLTEEGSKELNHPPV